MSGFKIHEPDGSVYNHATEKRSNLQSMQAEYEKCKANIANMILRRSDQIYAEYVRRIESKQQVSLKRQKQRRLEEERRRADLDHQIVREQQRAVELEAVLGVAHWICPKQEVADWLDATEKYTNEKKIASNVTKTSDH
jgi:hypothetical protein